MRRQQTNDQDRDPNPERAAADPKQLVDLTLNSAGVVEEVSTECLAQLACRLRLRLGFGEVNDYSDRTVDGKLAGPTDDKLLRLLIQIALPETDPMYEIAARCYRRGARSHRRRWFLSSSTHFDGARRQMRKLADIVSRAPGTKLTCLKLGTAQVIINR
jgi:hypothetical protein